MVKIISTILLLLTSLAVSAQDSLSLYITPTDKDDIFIKKNISYSSFQKSEADFTKTLRQVLMQLHDQSYLAASIDSLVSDEKNYTAYLHTGKAYEWANLENGNVAQAFLAQIGFRERLYSGKPFHYKEVKTIQEKLLTYAENNGFPFASVWLDSIHIDEQQISARLYMQKNRLMTFDGVNVVTETNISPTYLAGYLGVKSGALYSEEKVKKIRSRVREMAFLSEERPPNITFVEDKATVNMFLKNKKASRFDFLVGFLPRNAETGGFVLTGNAEIDLKNPFGTGKEIRVEWQQLRPGTQSLEAHFLYPYFIGLPFGFDLNFNLYKRDSSYLDLEQDIGVQYHFEGGNYLKVFWNNTSTNILEINDNQIINSRSLPANIDVSNSIFGLEYRLEKLDYRYNPRKGFDTKIRAGAGIKRIKENQQITALTDPNDPIFDYSSLYDTLELRSFQYRFDAQFDKFWAIGKRGTVKTGLNGGYILAKNNLYQNELFRIGGNRLLRGFDEEALLVSLYAVLTAEYRFIIGQNSYIYTFADYAYIESKTVSAQITDQPLGFGAGMTFETKAGIFGLSYALGRQLNNPIDFRAGKIHFGYVNLF